MRKPGWQIPHCGTCSAIQAACSAESRPFSVNPSMVDTLAPSTLEAGTEHERTASRPHGPCRHHTVRRRSRTSYRAGQGPHGLPTRAAYPRPRQRSATRRSRSIAWHYSCRISWIAQPYTIQYRLCRDGIALSVPDAEQSGTRYWPRPSACSSIRAMVRRPWTRSLRSPAPRSARSITISVPRRRLLEAWSSIRSSFSPKGAGACADANPNAFTACAAQIIEMTTWRDAVGLQRLIVSERTAFPDIAQRLIDETAPLC